MDDSEVLLSLGDVAVAVDRDTLTRQLLASVKFEDVIQGTRSSSSVELNDPAACAHLGNTSAVERQLENLSCEVYPEVDSLNNEEGIPDATDAHGDDDVSKTHEGFTTCSTSILHSLLAAKKREPEVVVVSLPSQTETSAGAGHHNFLTRDEETETERRIRTGEMTPFGNVIESDGQSEKTKEMMNFSSYLQTQIALQEEFKKSQSQKRAETNKRKRLISESESAEDEVERPPSLKNKDSGTKKNKDPLRSNLLFPKHRAKKVKLGTRSSKNKAFVGLDPGRLPSEDTAIYLSGDSDCDYLPQDDSAAESSDQMKVRMRKKKPRPFVKGDRSKRKKSKSKKSVRSDSDESVEYETEGDEQPTRTKKVGEYTDDGNAKFYLERVRKWKETETRFTKDVHSLEGGFKLPKYIWDSLYNYQKVGVKWLWELHQQRSGGILSDEMGLGKTIQIISFLAGVSCANVLFRFSEFRGVGPSLIVCPATVMNQWVQEFHKWWPPFRVGLLHVSGSYTGRREGFIRSIHDSRGFLITTYTGAVKNQDELLKYNWDYVILDEGHKIRNPDAQVTIAVKRLRTPHRIILSGSPLQNNLKELWSLFDFVSPGRLGTLPTFLEKFAVPITQGGYASASDLQVATAYRCATTLRDIISPYLLRRMKSDVSNHLKLPPKNEQVLFCKLAEEQKSIYQVYLSSDQIRKVIIGEHNVLVGLINLRKICNHPHLFDGGPRQSYFSSKEKTTDLGQRIPKRRASSEGNVGECDDEGDDIDINPVDTFGHWHLSGKMVVVRTLLRVWQKQGQKVLLFTQSRQMLCILEKFIQNEKYSYLRLDGGTTIGSRQRVIDKFNKDPSIFVFLLTTRVGGLGVNLTGANRVVIFDPDWNPSTDLQARERAWRIGQSREVTIYRLITSGTIEEKIYHRQIFKEFLTNRILKDPRQKRFFKKNDLLELFSFNDGLEGIESEALFEGTDSSVPRPRKRGRRNPVLTDEEARINSRGKFKGVPNLVKQRSYDPQKVVDQSETPKESGASTPSTLTQDEYVLRKLFKRSGVEAALKHDKIVGIAQPDHFIIEKEAEWVAKDAARILKKSREQCWRAETGKVTWTGANGTIRQQKKPTAAAKGKSGLDEIETSRSEVPAMFTQPKLFLPDDCNEVAYEPCSSKDLLAIIQARNRPVIPPVRPPEAEGDDDDGVDEIDNCEVEQSKLELLSDIRAFVAFQGTVNGEASTQELVTEFGKKLPPAESPLFKHMLKELCTSRQVQGQRIWRLKPEFR